MYLRCNQQIPPLDSPFERKIFSKELEYWGLPEYDRVLELLVKMFESVPANINHTALSKWNQIGPFNI